MLGCTPSTCWWQCSSLVSTWDHNLSSMGRNSVLPVSRTQTPEVRTQLVPEVLPSHPSTKVGRIALPKQVHFLCMAVCRWQIIWVDKFNPCKHRHTHRESDHSLYGNRDLKPQVGVALQCLLQDRNLLVAEGLDKQLRLPGRFLTALRSGLSQVHCVEGWATGGDVVSAAIKSTAQHRKMTHINLSGLISF